jgi:hypothetical protein
LEIIKICRLLNRVIDNTLMSPQCNTRVNSDSNFY